MYLSLEPSLRLEQIALSPYQGALELYGNSEKIKVSVPISKTSNRKLIMPAALVENEDTEWLFDNEKYAGTIGGMFFISRKTPEEYYKFVAFHELGEHAAPRGFDVTGLAKHYQALSLELAYAKTMLNPEQYSNYLDWRKSVEQTKFFTFKDDGMIDNLSQKINEIFDSIHPYLTYRRKKLVEIA